MENKYYFFIQANKINGKGQVRIVNDNILNIEVSKDVFDEYEKYQWDIDTQSVIFNENWEKEREEKERERINSLSLTAADIERALYKAKGIDFDDVIELAKQANEVQTVSLADDKPANTIDIKALKIELKANNFYRGHPYINQIGALLGYSSEDLDYLFQNKELPENLS